MSTADEELLLKYDLKDVLAKLQALTPPSLEEMLTSPKFFNLPASDLQRAIARAIDGKPLGDLAGHSGIVEAFCGVTEFGGKPLEVDILSAIRAGKSIIAAATGVLWTQTCDVGRLREGDIARVSVVSLSKKNAAAVYKHVLGAINQSPELRRLVVGEPGTETIVFRHPSGKTVELCIVAGNRAGGALVSTWSAGVIFDEYTRMVGDEEGVVNYDDMHGAVFGRLLPGAQILSIGSPYGSAGPAYSRYIEYYGKRGARVLVIKAPGWVMNPSIWTTQRCEQFEKDDPDVYRTDCAAEFSSPEDAMYSAVAIEEAIRKTPKERPFDKRCTYSAAMDPATRGNGWTLAIGHREGRKKIIDGVWEWRGTRARPLDSFEVMEEVATICKRYNCRRVISDQVSFDQLQNISRQFGLILEEKKLTSSQRLAGYSSVKLMLGTKDVELPPDRRLRDDLLRVRKRITAGGAIAHLPETGDGRHCDFAPSVMLILSGWAKDVTQVYVPTPDERLSKEEESMWAAASKRVGKAARKRIVYSG